MERLSAVVWFDSRTALLVNNIQIPSPICIDKYSKQDLVDYFLSAWQLEDILLKSIIQENAFYSSPDLLRNPLIFYLGHCAAFYINKLVIVGLLDKEINPAYEMLFGFGVDPANAEELNRANTHIEWPQVDKVWTYREQVYCTVLNVIKNRALIPEQAFWALLMSIEHQLIHFETSSMLFRQLPIETLRRPSLWQYAPYDNQSSYANEMVEVSGSLVDFGKKSNCPIYGWDNEYGRRQVNVAPFLISKYLVTNREFKIFVDNGGYESEQYWDQAGWQWKSQQQIKHPKFWIVEQDKPYQYRAIFDLLPLPLDWPVEVNHYEASAYCRAQEKEAGLMSEAQWNLVAYGSNKYSNYDPYQDNLEKYNLNLRFGSPCPVGMLEDDSPICDLRGNVWQWLSDDFNPFEEFEPHYLYTDYSKPYFNSEHKMMLGGSWATAGTQAKGYYRNWFRRGFYQHAGFRLSLNL